MHIKALSVHKQEESEHKDLSPHQTVSHLQDCWDLLPQVEQPPQ